MKSIFFDDIPYFKLNSEDIFIDLVENRKSPKKSKNMEDFTKYNRSIVDKMLLTKDEEYNKTKAFARIRILKEILSDFLLDAIKNVFLSNNVAIFKHYKIASFSMPIDEHFLESKKESDRCLKQKFKWRRLYAEINLNEQRDKFYQYKRVKLFDTRKEDFYVQFIYKIIKYGKRKYYKVHNPPPSNGETK